MFESKTSEKGLSPLKYNRWNFIMFCLLKKCRIKIQIIICCLSSYDSYLLPLYNKNTLNGILSSLNLPEITF